ncbi:hypothetical protein VC83_05701 [Pseudogymnoascus destructans]|uniref:Uncharacterized protein n=1 Tax=Pseudogymnoascus destructans TaxID=655981 RepID=A0A177A912_9PEZI|nr:uncharacterized protein VC83_05701 [Pseudogymnoascus destructans]OAF57741.1 hypothetical protein VC83_05701 [Pseudogymnoascus destructans]
MSEGKVADDSRNQSPVLAKSPTLSASTSMDILDRYRLKYDNYVAYSGSGIERRTVSLEGVRKDSFESDGLFDFTFPLFQRKPQAPLTRLPSDPGSGPPSASNYSTAPNVQGNWWVPPSLNSLLMFIATNLYRRFQKVAINILIFQWRSTKIDPRTGELKAEAPKKRLLDTPEALNTAYLEYSAQPISSESNVLYYTFNWRSPSTLNAKRPFIDTEDMQATGMDTLSN